MLAWLLFAPLQVCCPREVSFVCIVLKHLPGMAVTTVEGIGSARTRLHPVQVRIKPAVSFVLRV